jgi:CRP-like cAMP-binding protein
VLPVRASAPEGSRSLPRRECRRLAAATVAVKVDAGRRILRQGAFARGFFVVERGCAGVRRDGRYVAGLGPGDVFGALALLGNSLPH